MNIKASIFTRIAFGFLIAGSIAACKPSTTTTTTTAAPAGAKQDIVFFNEDTILIKYNYVKDMNKRLEDKGKSAQSDVQARGQAVQREVAEYQRNANTMTTDQRAAKEQQLTRQNQEFQQYQQNASTEFQTLRGDENVKLYEKLSEFAKGYAKEKGYKIVLTFSKGGATLLYAEPSLDVTNEVLKRLNDAYAKEKK